MALTQTQVSLFIKNNKICLKKGAINKGTSMAKSAIGNVTGKVTSAVNTANKAVSDAKTKINEAKSKVNQVKGLLNGNGLSGLLAGALGVLASNVMSKLMGKLQKVPALGILTKAAAVATLMTGVANAIKMGSSALSILSKQTKSGTVENDSTLKAIDPNYKGKTGNADATSATYKEYDSTTAEEKAKNAATVAEYSEKMLKKMPLQSKVESEAVKEYSNKMIAKMNKTITDNMNKANIKPTKL
jgi:ElaB/YqjD/DUF883 family membrane-anchored ribosome-binding protein